MISKDLIRKLNKYNKKHPNASVYFLTSYSENGFLSVDNIVLAYASIQQIQQNNIKEEDCIKNPKEGFEPIIVVG